MDIEAGEEVFGKRWNKWSVKEWDEFLACIGPDEVSNPAILNQVCIRMKENRTGMLPAEVKAKLMAIMLS